MNNIADSEDPFNLNRFVQAQENIYVQALSELRSGLKQTHWMWFIFPQIEGLGHSTMAKRYAIKNMDEARQYLSHPVLGARLLECVETVLAIEGRTASEIFAYPDDRKLKSCMTLFATIENQTALFSRILDKYFNGEQDIKTLNHLNQQS